MTYPIKLESNILYEIFFTECCHISHKFEFTMKEYINVYACVLCLNTFFSQINNAGLVS